jgi:hypothetical protein
VSDVCACGPERDTKDKELVSRGVPAMMLWFCCDCGKPRPGTPVAPGGEMYKPVDGSATRTP